MEGRATLLGCASEDIQKMGKNEKNVCQSQKVKALSLALSLINSRCGFGRTQGGSQLTWERLLTRQRLKAA
eukprot:1431287-Prymnesium_polylepis.1